MDPQIMAILQQVQAGQMGNPAQGLGGAVGGMPTGMPGAAGVMTPQNKATAMAGAMGAVQSPQVGNAPAAPVTYPDAPRAMNPAFSQMIMQALQGGQPGMAPGLGQLMGGMR